MSENKSNSSNGISFLGLLTILFIGLKLTGYIDWSWWWVLSPLWGGLVFVLAILAIALVIRATMDSIANARRKAYLDKHLQKFKKQ